MDEPVIDKILERLDRLGEIGVQGFEVLTRQALYEGVTSLAWACFLVILAVTLSQVGRKTFQGKLFKEIYLGSYENEEFHKPWGVIYQIISIALLFISFGLTATGIKMIINPEFYAIEMILSRL